MSESMNQEILTEAREKFELIEPNPDLDLGVVTMVLSESKSGLSVITDKSLPRTDEDFPYPLTTPELKQKVASNMPGQMGFTRGNQALEALEQYRTNPNPETKAELDKTRSVYLNRSAVGAGLRNIRRNGNTLTIDTRPVNFPVYRALAESGSDKKILEFAANSATSMSLVTKDNKLLVVHRSPKNDPYGDMPGASAGGYFDAKLNKRPSPTSPKQGHRTLEPITTDSVKANMLKEMTEELGLEDQDIDSLVITGLATEKTQVHHEFLLDGRLNLTAQEVKEKAARERHMDPEEFAEKFVDIEASPDAIMNLLTQLPCPMPPTHYAVFAATGYRMVLEQSGQKEANEYKAKLEAGIKANIERINTTVKNYYQNNPDVLTKPTQRQEDRYKERLIDFKKKNPNATEENIRKLRNDFISNLPKRNPEGYDAFFLPTEQGLPDFETSLRLGGLIK